MMTILIALGVGMLIGAFFQLVKLPVPVPHGLGGIAGLVGMFVGSQIVEMLSRHV
jgi:XapX domain-containing protein